jgi:tetratricopeptide (TPR) repeat protein
MTLSRRLLLLGIAGAGSAELSELAARAVREPANGTVQLRYAAALRAADQCDSAMVVARRAIRLAPNDALGPLVLGQCLEQGERYNDALLVYRTFLAAQPEGRGSAAVRAREELALRAGATQGARLALAREAELTAEAADPQTVAVLPVQVVGDSVYAPLSRGLAQMLTSDLALLQRFRLVERQRVGALLNELALSQTERVDPATAARVGRLMAAGRMVSGLATIPDERNVRLEASVVQGTGEVTGPARVQGTLRELLKIEKDLVVGLATQLGYRLSEAERQAVLENGTQNLTAFLAYSRALEAEDRGDYAAAARYYSEAVQADPSFGQARDGFQAATALPDVQAAAAGDAPVLAGQDPRPSGPRSPTWLPPRRRRPRPWGRDRPPGARARPPPPPRPRSRHLPRSYRRPRSLAPSASSSDSHEMPSWSARGWPAPARDRSGIGPGAYERTRADRVRVLFVRPRLHL